MRKFRSGLKDRGGVEIVAGDICYDHEWHVFGVIKRNHRDKQFYFCERPESDTFSDLTISISPLSEWKDGELEIFSSID